MIDGHPVLEYERACQMFLRAMQRGGAGIPHAELRRFQGLWKTCVERLQALADAADPAVWNALGDAYLNGRTDRRRQQA